MKADAHSDHSLSQILSERDAARAENAELRFEMSQMEAELRFLRGQRFRSVTERVAFQASLFTDEAVANDDDVDRAEDAPEDSARQRKRKRKRRLIPDNAPRIENHVDLADADKICEEHGCELERHGETRVERLEYTPPKIHVEVDICARYRCPICNQTAEPDVGELIPGSAASASLVAHIAVSKICDALPLYRQEGILRRSGIELSRTTMATWLIKTAEHLISLYNLISDVVKDAPYRGIDETPIQVHGLEGKKNTSNSFMWVMVGTHEHRRAVIYYFDPTRSSAVARHLLEGCSGYVHTDGYAAYGKVTESLGLKRLGCLMHIRRKFHTAYEMARSAKVGGEIAGKALSLIRSVYAVEAEAKGLSPPDRKKLRDEKTRPILEELDAHVTRHIELVPASSKIGEALAYCKSEWPYFIRFLEDGILEVDNGEVERRIKHFAVGRANWSFCDSKAGAEAAMILYTVLETARANGKEPFAYLTKVLRLIPDTETMADVERLLPWNLNTPSITVS